MRQRDELDRLVDYATALEATLVWEKDFNTRRISRRTAVLIVPGSRPAETETTVKLIRTFYEIRSRIVHGGRLSLPRKPKVVGPEFRPD